MHSNRLHLFMLALCIAGFTGIALFPTGHDFAYTPAPIVRAVGDDDGKTITLPNVTIYAANAAGALYILKPNTPAFVWAQQITGLEGNLIGIDFRVSDGNLYAVTDTGNIYVVGFKGTATLVSTMTPAFDGGVQSLMDFNPVLDAIRLIGSNDQNFAVVNNIGNLNQTVSQTKMAYAVGDVASGYDPNICGGAYTNNYVGAPNTIFYGLDYALDSFVTIAPPLAANGSSNTGGGKLQTIGPLVDLNGRPVNIAPTADFDIYTDPNTGVNYLIGINNQTIFTIDLGQINPNLPVGKTQNVVLRAVRMLNNGGGFIDIAIAPRSTNTLIHAGKDKDK